MAGQPRPGRKTRPQHAAAAAWPSGAHALAALGPETGRVVARHLSRDLAFNLFGKLEDADYKRLAAAFNGGWSDAQAARVVEEFARQGSRRRPEVELEPLCRWIRQHPDDADAVLGCMAIVPPDGVSVIRLLSRAGSQKRVFLASWKLTLREIVLKQIIAPLEQRREIVERESQAHPFSLTHPNIIETHPLKNDRGEEFLAEERLPIVLGDGWDSGGVQEAANLLYDVGKALRYLHGEPGLVHGDIKPDNIGSKDGSYILLDFGICRPAERFRREAAATGSLRTRAPELFEDGRYDDPPKADVWALGATVYKAVAGRFPFIDPGEPVPRVSRPVERAAFEATILERIRADWGRRVDLAAVPEPLRPILSHALARRPGERATAAQVVALCERHLAGFLRGGPGNGGITASEELRQLAAYLPRHEAVGLMPVAAKQFLRDRLNGFRQAGDLAPADAQAVDALLALLG